MAHAAIEENTIEICFQGVTDHRVDMVIQFRGINMIDIGNSDQLTCLAHDECIFTILFSVLIKYICNSLAFLSYNQLLDPNNGFIEIRKVSIDIFHNTTYIFFSRLNILSGVDNQSYLSRL